MISICLHPNCPVKYSRWRNSKRYLEKDKEEKKFPERDKRNEVIGKFLRDSSDSDLEIIFFQS